MQEFSGVIRSVYSNAKIFSIKDRHKIEYFYLSHSLVKKFEPYLQDGVYASFKVRDEQKIVDGVNAYQVFSFNKIYKVVGNTETVFYDTKEIKEGVKKLLHKDNYRLFIDLEFTMPPYDYHHNGSEEFISEIIEYGMYIEDASGNVIDSASGLVKPKYTKWINDRTCEFIGVRPEELLHAPSYDKFYKTFSDILSYYQPIIYIWGTNDYLMIDKSYKINNRTPLTKRSNFVNLMQIVKNYFSSRNDIGLYNAFNLLGSTPPMQSQDHNALHDAAATVEIFHLFEKELEK